MVSSLNARQWVRLQTKYEDPYLKLEEFVPYARVGWAQRDSTSVLLALTVYELKSSFLCFILVS